MAGLVERETELARVGAALAASADGAGQLVVVEGPAGIGKSSVLDAAIADARARGGRVLAAGAGEFEGELGYGVVRQLFEAAARGGEDVALAGAAGLARPLLLPRPGDGGAPDVAALMHGLYWVAANLAEQRPLVLCVDDAHWCDAASLSWLLYLARRLEDVAVLLLVAVRSGEPDAQRGVLAALVAQGEAIALEPLSEGASAQVVREGWAADDELCRACFEVTGGNPFLLRELARALAAQPGAPDADRVRGLTPATVARAVVARLGRLAPEAAALARALAVLGGRAEPRELLAFAGVEPEAGSAALDALARGQIADGRPVRFVHPLVGAAIDAELAPGRRAHEHARAARVLADAGAAPARVASHLLHAEPAGDAWAAGALRAAARSEGSPEAAVQWLARALAEPPPAAERAGFLHELGAAELRAGLGGERHLAEAVELGAGPLAALDHGDALWATHRYADAVAAFDAAARAADGELALRIEAHAAAAARLDLGTCALAAERLARFDGVPPPSPAGRLIAGVLAIDRALAGAPVPAVVALAERMLDGGALPGGHVGAQIPLFATNALLWCDRLTDARRLLSEMIAASRAAGSVRSVIVALCWHGHAAHRAGDLADAAADLATAVELAAEHSPGGTAVTHAMLAEVLVDRGDLDGAERALSPAAPPDEPPDYVGWNYAFHARGVLRAARLELDGALADFLACGERQERWGARNPSVLAWRSQAAVAGGPVELAEEELVLARRFGAPRPIGTALRALARKAGGERRVALLGEAVAVLAESEARLEHARALADLGAALRRANERAAAREPLREALHLATRCGAAPLAARAHGELVATGARARTPVRSGVDALTPVERQAAALAADGLSNPQIAQALFVSRKTVEKRLSDAYRKLGIGSRGELAGALRQQ